MHMQFLRHPEGGEIDLQLERQAVVTCLTGVLGNEVCLFPLIKVLRKSTNQTSDASLHP